MHRGVFFYHVQVCDLQRWRGWKIIVSAEDAPNSRLHDPHVA